MSSSRRSKNDKEREKVIQDRLQLLLTQMLKDDDNKYCVDCDSKGPRWASWNLGLFLCIRCAGIHRNLGVHISRVKSVNLDSWTPVQVSSMQLMGNSRARAVYEANLPDGFARPQNDQALEQFIRAKYEKKKYMAKEYVAQQPSEFPDGWYDLIEAEKQKKDLRKLILPSHRNGDATQGGNAVKETEETARPKPGAASVALPKPVAAPAALPSKAAASAEVDLLGLSLGGGNDSTDFGGLVTLGNEAPAPKATAIPGLGDLDDLQVTQPTSSGSTTNQNDADFFNQKQSDDGKMSKDSIMALFAKSGNSKPLPVQTNANIFGQPQPMFNSPQNAQTGSVPPAFGMPPQSSFGVNPQSNPFLNNSTMGANQFNASPQSNFNSTGGVATSQSNLSQFSGLNLGTNSFNGLVPASPMSATPAATAANPSSQANNLLGLW